MIQFNLVLFLRLGFIFLLYLKTNFRSTGRKTTIGISPERRCSSRTFRYGYLVTT